MSQLLDCLVTYHSAQEDADGLPRRYFCYHVLSGPGLGPDGGVAAIATLAAHDPSSSGTSFQRLHVVRTGGAELALLKALHYLDGYHEDDRLRRVQSEVRRPQTPLPASTPPGTEPAPLAGLRISAQEVLARRNAGQAITLLDVRAEEARNESLARIPSDIRVRPAELPANPPWPKDRLLVAYCSSPGDENSVLLAQELHTLGYQAAYALEGGLEAWRAAGGPVIPK
jgi:rhodanese-related sulfurtransferase